MKVTRVFKPIAILFMLTWLMAAFSVQASDFKGNDYDGEQYHPNESRGIPKSKIKKAKKRVKQSAISDLLGLRELERLWMIEEEYLSRVLNTKLEEQKSETTDPDTIKEIQLLAQETKIRQVLLLNTRQEIGDTEKKVRRKQAYTSHVILDSLAY